jgi:hypothetical protein
MYVEGEGMLRGSVILLSCALAGWCQRSCPIAGSPTAEALRSAVRRDLDPNCLLSLSDGTKTTPLGAAGFYGDTGTVRELLRKRANVDTGGGGDSPLLLAIRGWSKDQTAPGHFESIQALLEAGASAKQTDSRGWPAIVAACADHASGASPTLVKGGRTADVVAALLQAGADANARNPAGDTALIVAVTKNDGESARLLIQHGAKVRTWGSAGSTLDVMPPELGELRDELEARYRAELTELPSAGVPVKVALTGMTNLLRQAPSPVASAALDLFNRRWKPRPGGMPLTDPLVVSLTRDLYAMDVAVWRRDAALLQRVAEDLRIKAEDCSSREEGLAGNVPVTIKTVGRSGEVSGLRLRYVERFLWDLRDLVKGFETQWHECSRLSAAVKEPVMAGDYVVVAITREGRTSDPKFIEVAKNRPAVFEVVVP